MHQIIFVPGLGDDRLKLSKFLRRWKRHGIVTHVHLAPWKSRKEPLEEKVNRLVKKIDILTQHGEKVSIVATSAGGSLAINAYVRRKEKIHKIITLSSRLIERKDVFPSLSLSAYVNPAFGESVMSCQEILSTLTLEDKQKILTTKSRFFDEAVPISTMKIPGVKFLEIPVPLHVASISATMTIYKKHLIDFLKD